MVYLVGVTNHNMHQLVSSFRERNGDLRKGFISFVCVEVAKKHKVEHRFLELKKRSKRSRYCQ